MHKNFAALEAAVSVPAFHIADAVAAVAQREGWTTLGLLGARWVMEETFYAERLAEHGISVVAIRHGRVARAALEIFDDLLGVDGHLNLARCGNCRNTSTRALSTRCTA